MNEGYASENSVTKIDKLKLAGKPPGIFSTDQLESLLNKAPDNIQPGAFAGIRTAEILRLSWENVNLQRGFIEITANKAKTARRRLVTIHPCLAAWLAHHATKKGRVWPYTETPWRKCVRPIVEQAGISEWPEIMPCDIPLLAITLPSFKIKTP